MGAGIEKSASDRRGLAVRPADRGSLTDGVVVTPHEASATFTTRAAMVDHAVDNVLAVLHGRPAPDCVAAFPGHATRSLRSP